MISMITIINNNNDINDNKNNYALFIINNNNSINDNDYINDNNNNDINDINYNNDY